MVIRRRDIYRQIASCTLLLLSVSGMRCGGILLTPSIVSTTDPTTTTENIFVDVAVAGKFACGLDGAGRVYCWGGDGTIFTNSITPTLIAAAPSTKYIQKAYSGICGVTTAEDAHWCVGPGVYGPNAAGTYTFASPFTVSFAGMFGGTRTLFENDSNTMCAIDASNTGQCWGFNNAGQFGSGDTTTSFTPVAIAGGHTFSKIAPGSSAGCGIIASGGGAGNVFCWGNGSDGLIGNGTWTATQLTPIKANIMGSSIATDLAAGGNHFCAVGSAADVQCWGENSNGQLGDNLSSGIFSNVPRAVGSISTATAVRSAVSTSIAILQDGTLQCWGTNSNAQFGIGNTTPSASPVACGTGLVNIREVSMNSDGGATTVCALTDSGTIFCWGDNTYGQTGLAAGTATQSPGPELVHP